MVNKKKKYEAPVAYDLTHVVKDEVHAVVCKSGGAPSEAQCKYGGIADAKCGTGNIAGAQCRSGGTAVYTCRTGSLPNT